MKEWSVSLSGLPRLRTVGPHQKLGRRETSSLLDLTQSSKRLSHLDVTQVSGIMMSPSPFPPEILPNLEILTVPVLLFPFQTDRSSYHYLRLYWIWGNWVTCTTFRISLSTDSGTSSEARTAWVRIPPRSHPILPVAIPLDVTQPCGTVRGTKLFCERWAVSGNFQDFLIKMIF